MESHQKHIYDISKFVQESKRPLVIFGHGVKLADAEKEALDFVNKTGIPFLVSWGAFDMCDTDHPLRIGSPGVYGDRYANYSIQNADLLISIGSRLDSRQIGGNTTLFSRHSKKIMVDIDDHEITKMGEKGIDIDFKINENAKDFLQNVITGKVLDIEEWLAKLKHWKNKYHTEKAREGDSVVYDYLGDLFDKIEDDCIVIPDQGGNLVWTLQS